MNKIRVNGDAWIKKEMLYQIFNAQREIGEDYVDLLSYFGGFRLQRIEDSWLNVNMFFRGDESEEHPSAAPRHEA